MLPTSPHPLGVALSGRRFVEHGGFDFVVGNPPWIKLDWNESGFLSDFLDRAIVLDGSSANDIALLRSTLLTTPTTTGAYLSLLTAARKIVLLCGRTGSIIC